MRVWIDMTNSPHVPFFRPLIALLEERGHDVVVSARAFAQTLELLDAAGIAYEVVGPPHAGAGRAAKARTMGARLHALRRFARRRGFDLALSHASHELPIAARTLGIPSTYAYDYEFAIAQHTLGSRAATQVVVPEAIPQERLDRLGATVRKTRRYAGLKEEYYLAGFVPDPAVLPSLGLDRGRPLVVVRTPPEVSLYHLHGNELFDRTLVSLANREDIQVVVLPRTPGQRTALRTLGLPSLVVPETAVDAHSLVAAAAAVVSAGGTMNREAVALGTPVYTVFSGRLGAVDEQLVAGGRLMELRDPDVIELHAATRRPRPALRDPAQLLDLMLGDLAR